MASGYSVTSVNQSQQIGRSGNLEDVVVVTFELDNDAGSGSVSVPMTGDWEDAATAAIQQQVASMQNLLAL